MLRGRPRRALRRRPRGGSRCWPAPGSFVQVAVRRRGRSPATATSPRARPPRREAEGFATIDIDGRAWRSLTLAIAPEARLQVLSSLEQRRGARGQHAPADPAARPARARRSPGSPRGCSARSPCARSRGCRRAPRASAAPRTCNTPLPDEGPDEVRSLAGALNAMLARLQASTAATRRFAADAGHELRTPLTSPAREPRHARAQPGPAGGPARRAAARERRRAGPDRAPARRAAGAGPRRGGRRAPARGGRARRPRRRRRLRAPGAGIRASPSSCARPARARVHGWPNGLRLIVDNLLENAAIHGGGRVDVDLERDDGPLAAAGRRRRAGRPRGRARAAARAVRPRPRRHCLGHRSRPGDRRPAGLAARRHAAAGRLAARRARGRSPPAKGASFRRAGPTVARWTPSDLDILAGELRVAAARGGRRRRTRARGRRSGSARSSRPRRACSTRTPARGSRAGSPSGRSGSGRWSRCSPTRWSRR